MNKEPHSYALDDISRLVADRVAYFNSEGKEGHPLRTCDGPWQATRWSIGRSDSRIELEITLDCECDVPNEATRLEHRLWTDVTLWELPYDEGWD